MTATPLVSLGLPVHNGERFLAATLDSILGQSLPDFELIISDNASTDATPAICRRYARQDGRIRLVRADRNRGAAWNYNRVVGLARGRYFKWAGDDDLLAPDHLARCVEVLEGAGGSAVLCYPRTILIDAAGRELEHYEDRMDVRHAASWERLRHVLRHLRLCNAVFGVIRREVLLTTRLIGPYHSSDVVLLAELVLRGAFHEVPEPLFRRRRLHEEGSRQNLTDADKIHWFDPSRRTRHPFVRTRLFAEHLRSTAAAPLPARDRVRCARVLFAEWGPRHWRTVGGEFKRALRAAVRVGDR